MRRVERLPKGAGTGERWIEVARDSKRYVNDGFPERGSRTAHRMYTASA